jgi:hypothetical protein
MLGKILIFIIDDSGSAALSWLALSPVSYPHPTQTGGQRGTAAVARLPAFPHKPFISSPDTRACSRVLSTIVNHP